MINAIKPFDRSNGNGCGSINIENLFNAIENKTNANADDAKNDLMTLLTDRSCYDSFHAQHSATTKCLLGIEGELKRAAYSLGCTDLDNSLQFIIEKTKNK